MVGFSVAMPGLPEGECGQVNFRLPFPVTGNGKSRIRQKYIRNTRRLLAERCARRYPLYGDLTAKIRFTPPDDAQSAQRRDLDNLLKPVLDAMKGTVIDDDSQIKLVVAEMMPPVGAGEVAVSIYPRKHRRKFVK